MKKKILGLALLALTLTGCSASVSDGSGSAEPAEPALDQAMEYVFSVVPLPDGREVLCIQNPMYSAISCDWDNAE